MKPSTPLLSVLLYTFAAIEVCASALVILMMLQTMREDASLQSVATLSIAGTAAGSIIVALVLCGIGQAVSFLSESAYYARKQFELMDSGNGDRPAASAVAYRV
jgi:uncharacterized membrane protein